MFASNCKVSRRLCNRMLQTVLEVVWAQAPCKETQAYWNATKHTAQVFGYVVAPFSFLIHPSWGAMAKRTINQDVGGYVESHQKDNYQKSIKALQQQFKANPSQLNVSKDLLTAMAGGGAPSPSEKPTKVPHSPSLGVIGKMADKTKKDMLLRRCLRIKPPYITMWKLSDINIVEQLFEFEFGIAPSFTWPQGKCHQKGMMETIIPQYADKIQQPPFNSRIAGLNLDAVLSNTFFPWSDVGIYQYWPPGEKKKTHVLHRPSGNKVPLIPAVPATDEWSFGKNWGDFSATFLEPEGYGNRPCHSLFNISLLGTSNEQWVTFATNCAEGMENEGAFAPLVNQAVARMGKQRRVEAERCKEGGSTASASTDPIVNIEPTLNEEWKWSWWLTNQAPSLNALVSFDLSLAPSRQRGLAEYSRRVQLVLWAGVVKTFAIIVAFFAQPSSTDGRTRKPSYFWVAQKTCLIFPVRACHRRRQRIWCRLLAVGQCATMRCMNCFLILPEKSKWASWTHSKKDRFVLRHST